ncbi:MAG: ferrous iron transport protein B [Spirochaetia bacterium]
MNNTKNNPVIALAGNPNSGKTTLFNSLTGGNQYTGNWPGVTVEHKEGKARIGGRDVTIVDLPGIYSLSATSEDEKSARDFLLSGSADLVVNIIDSTRMERNLYLTTQLMEMQVSMVLLLNMSDLAEKEGTQINLLELQEHLTLPAEKISATSASDQNKVHELIVSGLTSQPIPHQHIQYPNEVEDVISKWYPSLTKPAEQYHVSPRWIGVKILEGDKKALTLVEQQSHLNSKTIYADIEQIEAILQQNADIVIADYKYGFIHGLVNHIMKRKQDRISLTDKIDKAVMHPILGIPIFLGVMYLLFWITMTIGNSFVDFFDSIAGLFFRDFPSFLLEQISAPDVIHVLIVDGIGVGIQTVAALIPVIAVMFAMLSILEDSGYMARAAFVMDRYMRWIGLPGKAFVPLIVGFGCTVPAILGTRTLDTRRDRLITIFMSPLMSCGARFPVYAIFVAVFFPGNQGTMIFLIYLIGVLLAVATGLLFKNTLFPGDASHFIMELPPYHKPRPKHIGLHTWFRLKHFIIRAGSVIIIAATILGAANSIGRDLSFGNQSPGESVLAAVGEGITPVFSPMGIEDDNWPASVALFTGIFAKEAIIGTLNSMYSQESGEGIEPAAAEAGMFQTISEAFSSIPTNLALELGITSEDINDTGSPVFIGIRRHFNPYSAFAYLLFVLIYFPCFAATGVAFQQMGTGYGILLISYLTVLAWSTATLFYQISYGHSIIWILAGLAGPLLIFIVLKIIGNTAQVHHTD